MPRRTMPEIPRDEAIRLYASGWPVTALARRYGVSATYLTARFRRWRVPLRGRAEAARLRGPVTWLD